jgi:uncharacterized protein YndB with AHSA1/START domain
MNVASDDYTREIPYATTREQVFGALTTLEGLAGWWTPLVTGSPDEGGELEFRFAGLDEKIVMRVDQATPPSTVIWTCLVHTGHPEWNGTTIVFELDQATGSSGVLRFHHVGLKPTLRCYETCESGWEHFLASVVSYAQTGNGTPF